MEVSRCSLLGSSTSLLHDRRRRSIPTAVCRLLADECSFVTGTIAYMAIDWRNAPSGLVTFHGFPPTCVASSNSAEIAALTLESVRQIPVRQHDQRLHALLACFGTAAEELIELVRNQGAPWSIPQLKVRDEFRRCDRMNDHV